MSKPLESRLLAAIQSIRTLRSLRRRAFEFARCESADTSLGCCVYQNSLRRTTDSRDDRMNACKFESKVLGIVVIDDDDLPAPGCELWFWLLACQQNRIKIRTGLEHEYRSRKYDELMVGFSRNSLCNRTRQSA